MITHVRMFDRVTTKAILASRHAFRGGMAYVFLKSLHPGGAGVVCGFDRCGRNRWRCEEMMRGDYPLAQGLDWQEPGTEPFWDEGAGI